MSVDRLKLLFAVQGTPLAQLTCPRDLYLTGTAQWALLIEMMGHVKAAEDDAAENGFQPPHLLRCRTVEELKAAVEGAACVRSDRPSNAAISDRPPKSATFTAWWERMRLPVPVSRSKRVSQHIVAAAVSY